MPCLSPQGTIEQAIQALYGDIYEADDNLFYIVIYNNMTQKTSLTAVWQVPVIPTMALPLQAERNIK